MSISRARSLVARAAFAFLLGFATAGAAFADDLPGRVGRLADLGGRVYLSSEERAEDWVEALRNYSLTSGDNLWVAEEGRVEVDYGGGQFRLAEDTNVHVARLDDQTVALFVAHGRVIVRVRALDAGESAHVDTPNTQVALTRPGLYRIEVSEDRSRTTLIVREGEATIGVPAGIQQVLPGQTAIVEGSEPTVSDVRNGYSTDGFDSWSANRDRRYERSRSASHVSRQMIGAVDLDDYGHWDTTPEYGAIWYPTSVAAGWAPYRHGRWTSVAGFGWTWVDEAPWGYAPFHYGRWVHVGNRWGWCPGAYVARPAWAPALVGWYGGSAWSASVSFGAPVYGWVPLGWGEPYRPSWRGCSERCWTRYNRPYAVNLAERRHAPPTRYTNWSVPGGVTAVAGATFTGRHPVHANLVAVRPQSMASAPVLAQAPLLAKPTAATIPGAGPPTGRAPPPAEHFYRTKPLRVAPADTPTWGSAGARSPAATPTPAASRPAFAPRGSSGAAVAAQPFAPAPAISAPPAERSVRSPHGVAHSQGSLGSPPSSAPRTLAPPGTIAPARSEFRGPSEAVRNRAESRGTVPPGHYQGGPAQRGAPQASFGQQGVAPPVAARPTAGPPVAPVPASRPAPSAAATPLPHSVAPPAHSAPQGVRSAPPSGKPVSQREGDRPTGPR